MNDNKTNKYQVLMNSIKNVGYDLQGMDKSNVKRRDNDGGSNSGSRVISFSRNSYKKYKYIALAVVAALLSVILFVMSARLSSEEKDMIKNCTLPVTAFYYDEEYTVSYNTDPERTYVDYYYKYTYDEKEYTAKFTKLLDDFRSENDGRQSLGRNVEEIRIFIDPNEPSKYYMTGFIDESLKMVISGGVMVLLALICMILHIEHSKD